MKLTKDAIFQHLRQTGYPLWTLCVLQNYRRLHIMSYNGDDFSDDEKPAAKIEKSLSRLQTILETFPPEMLFTIELKNSKTANGNGVIGPLEFVNNNGTMEEPAAIGAMPAQLGTVPPGFVSEQYLNGKIEELKAENQKAINDLVFKYREEQFLDHMKRKEQELADLEKEMKDEKKKYESQVGKWADTLGTALQGIITKFVPALQQQPAALGSAEQSQPATEQQATDPKYKAVEQFANELYNHASESEINEIINAYRQKQHVTDTDKTNNGQAA